MAQYNEHAPFSALNASWASVIPVTRRFSVIPSIYGRILIGRDFPYPLQNAIGGDVPGFYIPQQLPFAGVTNLELMDNTIMIASIKFRQRMGAIHYLTLTGNYGLTNSNFFDILKGKQLFGVSAGYGMDSIFGTIGNIVGILQSDGQRKLLCEFRVLLLITRSIILNFMSYEFLSLLQIK